MLSYQAREYYNFLNQKIEEFEPHIQIILEFSDKYKENITNCLKKVLGTKHTTTSTGSTITYYGVEGGKIIDSFKNTIKEFKSKFNFFDVFSQYSILKNEVNKYLEQNRIEDKSIKGFFDEVDNFFLLYQKFMQSDNDINLALDFGQCVKEFERTYMMLKNSYTEIEKNLLEKKDLLIANDDSLKNIEIQLLGTKYSFEEFINKLTIINNIYCEIGNIIYKETTYKRLEIIKVESGSLLSAILGDKNIIESLSLLINKSINLVFNKFTYEGKIYRHKEFRDELLADVDLVEKMRALGYDVEEARKNNNESLTMLTSDLLKIANSSSKIKVDNKEYNIDTSARDKFLDETKTLQLTSGEEE